MRCRPSRWGPTAASPRRRRARARTAACPSSGCAPRAPRRWRGACTCRRGCATRGARCPLEVRRRADVVLVTKARGPPLTHLGGCEVEVDRRTWPAPAVVLAAVLGLYKVTLGFALVVDLVARVLLDVRVDDGDHLAAGRRKLVLHRRRVGELVLVPREVPLAVGVLDVEPQHVVRQVEGLELPMHMAHVGLVVVVPPALMRCVLCEDRCGRGAWEQHEVDDAALAHEVRQRRVLLPPHVHKRLGGVEPQRRGRLALLVRQQQRHAAVQGHRRVELVIVHVERPQPVGLGVHPLAGVGARGGLEVECRRVLGQPVGVRAPLEAHVDAHRGGPKRFGVVVRSEALLPQAIRRARRGGRHRLRVDALDLPRAVGVDRQAVLAVVDDRLAAVHVGRRAARGKRVVVARAVVLEVELVVSVGDGHELAALIHLQLERVHLQREHTAAGEAVRAHVPRRDGRLDRLGRRLEGQRRGNGGSTVGKWAAFAVAGRLLMGPPLPGSAELPRVARRALRRHRGRAGALPRGAL
eukprot:scaffold49387_cov72-Phaeocystis_antarctica.AAC.8